LRWFWENPDFNTKKNERFFFVNLSTPHAKKNLPFFFVPFPNEKSPIPQRKISYISRDHRRATYPINAE
jgi:hypothetical protein